MRNLFIAYLLSFCCSSSFSAVAMAPVASSGTAATLTPEQARQALAVLDDPNQRAQTESTLKAIAAADALSPPAAEEAAVASASASRPIATDALKSNGLAVQLAGLFAHWIEMGGGTLKRSAAALLDISSAQAWWRGEISDPRQRAHAGSVLLALIGALLPALFLERLAHCLMAVRGAIIVRREMRETGASRESQESVTANGARIGATASLRGARDSGNANEPNVVPSAAMSNTGDTGQLITALRSAGSSAAIGGDQAVTREKASSQRHVAHQLTMFERLPSAAVQLFVRLLPLAVFIVVASALMALTTIEGSSSENSLGALIELYAVCRAIVIAAGFFLQPGASRLRLVRASDNCAAFIQHWVIVIVTVIGGGGALIQIARALALSDAAYLPLVKLLALAGHLMVSMMILRCRAPIRALLLTRSGERQWSTKLLADDLIDLWAGVAIFIVLALWFAWALDVYNGYRALLRVGGLTLVVLVAARLVSIVVFGTLARFLQPRLDLSRSMIEQHTYHYYPLIRFAFSTYIICATAFLLLEVWGVDAWQFFTAGAIGHRLFFALLTITAVTVIALVVWEAVNVAVDRRLEEWTTAGAMARAARLRTVVPILRTILFVVLAFVVAITGLSELGVNTAPLSASASIFGVALGFGSQKLVQDLITGIFLLGEDAIQVGDWVTLAGASGSVEDLSIRTVRLRAGDGTLYVVPFSSVSVVNNTNRGLGNASIRVSMAYGQDVEPAIESLKDIATALRKDEQFKDGIVADFSFWGVDAVDGASITLAGQIQCRDTARWPVQREFNRRIMRVFAEKGIQMANPQRNVVVGPKPRTNGERRAK